MVMRTRSQTLRSANRAPQSPLVAANDQASIILANRTRQRQERAARYVARVARAEARAQAAAALPPSPPPLPLVQSPPPPQESAPPPHIRRPLVTICDNGLPPPSHQSRSPLPVFTGRENAPPPITTNSRLSHHNRSSTDRVVGPYTLSRLR